MYRRAEHPTRYRIQLGNGGTDWFTRFARGFVAATAPIVSPVPPAPPGMIVVAPRPAETPGWVWPAVLLGGGALVLTGVVVLLKR